MEAGGYSLDDKCNPLLPPEKLCPTATLTSDEHARNNLPDILARWRSILHLQSSIFNEHTRQHTAQSFMVPKEEIAANGYDLSLNRCREVEYEEVKTDPPKKILAESDALEQKIIRGLKELGGWWDEVYPY